MKKSFLYPKLFKMMFILIIMVVLLVGGIFFYVLNHADTSDTREPVCESYYNIDNPRICDIDSTIKLLRESKMSFARLGDGEMKLIEGGKCHFQKPSQKMAYRLKEVLSSSHKNIMIGIPSELYFPPVNEKSLWKKWGKQMLPLLEKYLNRGQVYYPMNVSHLSQKVTSEEIKDDYFKKMRTIWQDKNVHLIHGKGIFDGFKYDIFDNAKSITHQIAPARDAFEEYDKILEEALKTDKNRLIIIILGPTATVLAHDLALKGYKALDLGHIAKAYDRYKRAWNEGLSFWQPDGDIQVDEHSK